MPIRSGGEVPTEIWYQTEPPVPAQRSGSLVSVVAPAVVPLTLCGSAPRLVASERSSLGGDVAAVAADAEMLNSIAVRASNNTHLTFTPSMSRFIVNASRQTLADRSDHPQPPSSCSRPSWHIRANVHLKRERPRMRRGSSFPWRVSPRPIAGNGWQTRDGGVGVLMRGNWIGTSAGRRRSSSDGGQSRDGDRLHVHAHGRSQDHDQRPR